jgi:hypothetical protein
MFGFFKVVMYLGVVLGIVGFAMLYVQHPSLASVPENTRQYISFGGLGLIVLGLVGRMLTRPADADKVEWK